MVILLTGFEPFDGHEVNPSQAIVEALAQRSAGLRRAQLVTEILPCEFRAAGERIVTLIRELRPEAVVSVGLAASASAIRLERHGLNLNDSLRPTTAVTWQPGGRSIRTGRLATGRRCRWTRCCGR